MFVEFLKVIAIIQAWLLVTANQCRKTDTRLTIIIKTNINFPVRTDQREIYKDEENEPMSITKVTWCSIHWINNNDEKNSWRNKQTGFYKIQWKQRKNSQLSLFLQVTSKHYCLAILLSIVVIFTAQPFWLLQRHDFICLNSRA